MKRNPAHRLVVARRVDLLDHAAVYPALARLSRGVGLPDGWPDVLAWRCGYWTPVGPAPT